MEDPSDIAIVSKLQDGLKLTQKERGSYKASYQWDKKEVLAMREKYQEVVNEKGITSDMMFGKKEELTLENHNCGTAYGCIVHSVQANRPKEVTHV